MHFLILLALAQGPCHMPSATCNAPSVQFQVPPATSHEARRTLHTARGTLHQARGPRHVEESVQSAALSRAMKYRVLLPRGYHTSEQRYPVLYLLHGLDGDYTDWTTRTNLAAHSRELPLIIVMPDGGNSWYTNAADSPADRFEDYILGDLQADVVRKYRTVTSRYGRAIAGLSMGGYGALKLSLKHPAAFALAGSFSGAFSITDEEGIRTRLEPRERERVQRIFGAIGAVARRENDVYALAAAAKAGFAPYLYLDCGTTDFLLEDSRRAVAAISGSGLAYEYHEVAGAHSWDYWDRRIREFLPVLMKKLAN